MILEQLVESVTFAAGEISPLLHNRRDLGKRQTGLSKLENMVVLVEGGADRRPGTRFVLPVKVESERAAFIRFLFSTTDSYLLVFNGGVVRFFKNGGYVETGGAVPYEVAQPYAAADLKNLRASQSGNEIYLQCKGYAPQVLRRNGPIDWTLIPYVGEDGPLDTQNLVKTDTIQASAVTVGAAITLTANTARFQVSGDVGTIWRLDEADLSVVPLWTPNEAALVVGNQRRYNGRVYEVVSGADAGVNPPTVEEGDFNSGQGKVVWRYLHSGFGLVRITVTGSANSATATVLTRLPDSVVSAPTYRWWPPAWSVDRGWPETSCIFQNRLWFFRGDQFWATQTDFLYKFLITFDADGGIAGRFRSDSGSLVVVEWAAASGVLAIGMRDGEWLTRASVAAAPITATDINPIAGDRTEGSTAHAPAKVDGGVVFIGRDQKRLHFVEFNFQSERLDPQEVTLAARHVLEARAVAVTFQRDPNRVLWLVTESGELAAFTFLPIENVLGAHRHPMRNGIVENAETIFSADGRESETYFVVRRTIAGVTRRYIEQLTPVFRPQSKTAPTAVGAWFVDCGLRYQGPAATVITGLSHVEGETVAVNVNGRGHRQLVVAGGAVTLDVPATDALIGLPIPYRLRTLAFEIPTRKGVSKGMAKRANHVVIDVVNSAGGKVSSNDGPAEDLTETGGEDYGTPQPLVTGQIPMTLFSPEEDEAIVEIFGEDTMPLTVTGIAPDLDVAGA